MNISILGTGNVALGLATALSAVGYEVTLGSRDAALGSQKAAELSRTLGRQIHGGAIPEAAGAAEVIFLAVPFGAVSDVLEQTGSLAGKTIVDVTNPLTDDLTGLTIGFDTSAAEEIQALVQGGSVIKRGFNSKVHRS